MINWFKKDPIKLRLETVRRGNRSKIFLNGTMFDFDKGMRLLVTKHKDTAKCSIPIVREYGHLYKPYSIEEALKFSNAEHRRVAMACISFDEFLESGIFELYDRQTIDKQTTWCLEDGTIETVSYKDTYELYSAESSDLNIEGNEPLFLLKFKDTSTERIYYSWVDFFHVCRINNTTTPTAIDAIAWTITAPCDPKYIKEITRQGDCIMCLIDKKEMQMDREASKRFNESIGAFRYLGESYSFSKTSNQHLTGKQYLELIKNES